MINYQVPLSESLHTHQGRPRRQRIDPPSRIVREIPYRTEPADRTGVGKPVAEGIVRTKYNAHAIIRSRKAKRGYVGIGLLVEQLGLAPKDLVRGLFWWGRGLFWWGLVRYHSHLPLLQPVPPYYIARSILSHHSFKTSARSSCWIPNRHRDLPTKHCWPGSGHCSKCAHRHTSRCETLTFAVGPPPPPPWSWPLPREKAPMSWCHLDRNCCQQSTLNLALTKKLCSPILSQRNLKVPHLCKRARTQNQQSSNSLLQDVCVLPSCFHL